LTKLEVVYIFRSS